MNILPTIWNRKKVLVSNGHLDHCGAVPNLIYQNPEVYMIPSTQSLPIF